MKVSGVAVSKSPATWLISDNSTLAAKKIFVNIFTIYGRGGNDGHVTRTVNGFKRIDPSHFNGSNSNLH